ncbi:hypothetical protein KSP39_PZI002764 [Platanthera zijinensis]|uniref:FHA domain-containing protein n=1 Tax=Platanthera zijinensis TaxID=2320716 RepID=A0AAP0GEU4_9ASPA
MAVEISGDRPREPSARELSGSSSSIPKPALNPQDEMLAVARTYSDQPLPNSEPGVWAVLTAISKIARLRPQGVNMLLIEDEHTIGRCVEDPRFHIKSNAISAFHCKIFRERGAPTDDGKADSNIPMAVFLRDTSTNGTYHNWVKLRKRSSKARLIHGDIISFVLPPHDENSYAFVYREVTSLYAEGLKRKSEHFGNESKRLKGIGIGAPDGPISLDDVRCLQRSNMELRQQLEFHVVTIEDLRKENKLMDGHHENKLKEQKEALSNSYQDRIKDLLNLVDAKQKELDDTNATSAELQNSIKDLNERHNASLQSRSDADEIINSQKATISELEAQLDEERNQRREEWEKAEMDLKSAIQRAHLEAQEEIKRQADVYLRQHREQQEFITKLQESEKESRLLVEMQRSKLEDARESLVTSEKKFRLLEAQFQDEVLASVNSKKKLDAVESEVRKLKKELENEKAAREEAWAKVSSLELEIAAAIRDLSTEKQRFQGARERIILRETQLRAFYSTTEEISSLFSKQQEQLKAMQKTLEDEENYENSLFAIDPTTTFPDRNASAAQTPRESTGVSTPRNSFAKNSDADDMDDDADNCSTQKHDCPNGTHDGYTQDLEGGSPDVLARGFGSDINGEGTATVPDFEPMDTERIVGTESQAGDFVSDERNVTLVKCSNMDGETARIDDEVGAQDSDEPREGDSNSKTSPRSRKEDDEASTIRTADLPASEAAGSWALDLLASEAVGSWALDTAPSVYGENESLEDHGAGTCRVLASDGQEAGSQSNTACGTAKLTKEQCELSAMIQIVEPNFKQKFYSRRMQRSESPSDAETEDRSGCSSSGAGGVDSGGDSGEEANATTDADVMIEDSVG